MQKVAQFHKVSREQFQREWQGIYTKELFQQEVYENIILPKRATVGSAGYDFYTPVSLHLEAGETAKIPTGIRAEMDRGWVLMLFPRSGLGFQYRLQLDNSVGIIDADYFQAKNEGHIIIKITNDSKEKKTLFLESGKGFAQGIFVPFGITVDDEVADIRTGGFGSTD